jgi:hypothetical protein
VPSNPFHLESRHFTSSPDEDLNNSLDSVMRDLTVAFFAHIDVKETLAHLLTATAVARIEDTDYADFMLINDVRFASVARPLR